SVSASATLYIAADNSYDVKINGVDVASNPTEENYLAANEGKFNVSSALHNGTNTISITVANFGVPGLSTSTNPAGLAYQLDMQSGIGPCVTTSTTNYADLAITKT